MSVRQVKVKIKQNDDVIVIAGKDKGKRGKVLKVQLKQQRPYVLVEGVNLVKKHMRPNPQANQKGGIVEREALIDISNVALINPVTDKADRVYIKTLEDGRKVRVCKSNDEVLDVKE